MTAKPGTYRDGELWIRCPYCGDSNKRRDIAHFSITSSGLFHCLRCGRGGRYDIAQTVRVFSAAGAFDVAFKNEANDLRGSYGFSSLLRQIWPGPGTSRESALDRFHLGSSDAFLSRDIHGEIFGLCIAGGIMATRQRKMYGKRLLGFKGANLGSTMYEPLRLVEGPYDCVTHQDVCVFGSIGIRHIKMLTGHWVILCPDGDIWHDDYKRSLFLRCLQDEANSFVLLSGVEILPDKKDPDEVPVEKRLKVSPSECLSTPWKALQARARALLSTD